MKPVLIGLFTVSAAFPAAAQTPAPRRPDPRLRGRESHRVSSGARPRVRGLAGNEGDLLLRLAVPADETTRPGVRAVFSVAPEDVLVATRPLVGISARNVHPGRVISREISGATAWIRIAAVGLEWTARLTLSAAEELALAPGTDVWIAVKTHAFRRLR